MSRLDKGKPFIQNGTYRCRLITLVHGILYLFHVLAEFVETILLRIHLPHNPTQTYCGIPTDLDAMIVEDQPLPLRSRQPYLNKGPQQSIPSFGIGRSRHATSHLEFVFPDSRGPDLVFISKVQPSLVGASMFAIRSLGLDLPKPES